ncbi:hypothetical protein EW146_g4350 [Bondarzewia mesenterica]|uniref:Uncharacterized protein n=1 Tax=Bondarzewia mesenterica TaxID=1095465 RepID=A0A4S4LUT4_9AGAM|nr:hypothetical protein EW146_g4350 [Bondarzewia mesenterica]
MIEMIPFTRFGSLSNSYMATADIANVQQMFFYYPEFSYTSLELAEELKGIMTLGELFTIAEVFSQPAFNYTGSILVVSGDKDFVVCGGNCYQSVNGSANLLEPARMLFPAASKFSTYIPARVGHAINAHFGAPDTYRVIEEWIGS